MTSASASPQAKKTHRFVQARMLNPIYTGMVVVDPPQSEERPSVSNPNDLVFLPLNEIKIDTTILESIALTRMEQEFVCPEGPKLPA